jgi:pantoate--beta-alanine ligase
MGALHAGHVSLMERAREECGFVVATIFVNPTQFGPGEDFTRYPRTLDADLELCRRAGVDLVFTPDTSAMYGPDAQTSVQVTKLSRLLEGAHRPGHFDGVCTIVLKLFQITEPDRAYFGQKDYQQQLIIRRMVQDLDLPVNIVTCPIVREPDGLAMSSRNRYLSATERALAAELWQALELAARLAGTPGVPATDISMKMAGHLSAQEGIELQYAMLVDPQSLEPVHDRPETAVALIAARVGSTRLIDNRILRFR